MLAKQPNLNLNSAPKLEANGHLAVKSTPHHRWSSYAYRSHRALSLSLYVNTVYIYSTIVEVELYIHNILSINIYKSEI